MCGSLSKRDWPSSAKWTRSVSNFLAAWQKFPETEKQFSSLDISSSGFVSRRVGFKNPLSIADGHL